MTKKLTSLLMLLTLCLTCTFSACSSDDDNSTASVESIFTPKSTSKKLAELTYSEVAHREADFNSYHCVQKYGYDNAGRLVKCDIASTSFHYDGSQWSENCTERITWSGNTITVKRDSLSDLNYTLDQNGRIINWNDDTAFKYGTNNNLTNIVFDDYSIDFSWEGDIIPSFRDDVFTYTITYSSDTGYGPNALIAFGHLFSLGGVVDDVNELFSLFLAHPELVGMGNERLVTRVTSKESSTNENRDDLRYEYQLDADGYITSIKQERYSYLKGELVGPIETTTVTYKWQ